MSNSKPVKHLHGTALGTPKIGTPLEVKTAEGVARISSVLHSIEQPDGRIWVETKDCQYWIIPQSQS